MMLLLIFAVSAVRSSLAFLASGRLIVRQQHVRTTCVLQGTSNSMFDFTTSELKRLLSERGVDFRDCLEKSELVARLQKTLKEGSEMDEDAQLKSLTPQEQSTIELFQRCQPSVALIESRVLSKSAPLSLKSVEVPAGSGSGFVWDTQGHIVTNYHVIQQAGKAVVTGLGDGMASYEAVLVGAEPSKDIAVLKVDAPASVLRPIAVGSSSELLVGQNVYAIGNPFGLDGTLTRGIISAVGREVQGIGGRPIKGCIQTDAAINTGNSGGPLLDSAGRLIGVNTAIPVSGIGGFAIPVDTVRRIVNQLIRYGRIVRPSLGVSVADDQMTHGISRQLGRQLDGVLVMDAPSQDAGLVGCIRERTGAIVIGDLITEVNSKRVKTVEDLLTLVELTDVGAVVTLSVLRGPDHNATETLEVKTVDRLQLVNSR